MNATTKELWLHCELTETYSDRIPGRPRITGAWFSEKICLPLNLMAWWEVVWLVLLLYENDLHVKASKKCLLIITKSSETTIFPFLQTAWIHRFFFISFYLSVQQHYDFVRYVMIEFWPWDLWICSDCGNKKEKKIP